jgi:hypothetical protein
MADGEQADRLSDASRRYWWWNGRQALPHRLDVLIYRLDEGGWMLELREGGRTGFIRWLPAATEAEALRLAAAVRQVGDGWRPVPVDDG